MNFNNNMDHIYLNDTKSAPKQKKKKTTNEMFPLFEEYLPVEYRGIYLPYKIMIRRNFALIAIFIQIASSITGFSFYIVRRVLSLNKTLY